MIDVLNEIKKYDITYNKLGKSDRSSMPIGNGDLALSVWVQEDGIKFYIAKSDAQTEYDRNVKLGKVAISLSPNPFEDNTRFTQKLNLTDGVIEIKTYGAKGASDVKIIVDSYNNNIIVKGIFATLTEIKVEYINWRKKPSNKRYKFSDVTESADVVDRQGNKIIFFHKNDESIVSDNANLQALGEYVPEIDDTIKDRIFGGLIYLNNAKSENIGNSILQTTSNEFEMIISVCSTQKLQLSDWIDNLEEQIKESSDAGKVFARTKLYWNNYWNQSWFFVDGDENSNAALTKEVINECKEPMEYSCAGKSNITKAYILTKWMFACCSNGYFPIHYNGMLFNLMPGGGMHFEVGNFGRCYTAQPETEPNMEFNPDERSWCIENLWQNLRHPYYSMFARNESNYVKVLFKYFERFTKINKVRAKVYHNANGQYNNEMTTTYGLQTPEIYGMDRTGYVDGYIDNRAGGGIDICPGLELIQIMLEYYDYTNDTYFLHNELIPYFKDLLIYIETRFTKRIDGKINLYPVHSAETYRGDVADPITVVAGLKYCLNKILNYNRNLIDDYDYYVNFEKIVPEIPKIEINETQYLSPARIYTDLRENVECPELYSMFPFKIFGINKQGLDIALNTFKRCIEVSGCFRPFTIGDTPGDPSYSGWQYIGNSAALLGMTEEAKEILQNNCSLQNPGTRFPAMWGPIYDAVPDTDHGANILNLAQLMAFQTEDDEIYLLPSWPPEWDVSFKFYAPKNTTIELVYKEGKIEKLEVLPVERTKNVHISFKKEQVCMSK